MLSVLLGAGASRQAGLPLATELTTHIIESIDKQHKSVVQFVQHGMQMQRAAIAQETPWIPRPSLDIDSESLYNTLDDLVHRNSLDIAPFVSSWHPMLTNLGTKVTVGELDVALQRAFKSAIESAVATMKPDRIGRPHINANYTSDLARKITQMISGARLNEAILSNIQQVVLSKVQVSDSNDVEYLSPLLQVAKKNAGLTIATLNYDTTIENLCRRAEFPYSDGIDDVDASNQADQRLAFRSTEQIMLYKFAWLYVVEVSSCPKSGFARGRR